MIRDVEAVDLTVCKQVTNVLWNRGKEETRVTNPSGSLDRNHVFVNIALKANPVDNPILRG